MPLPPGGGGGNSSCDDDNAGTAEVVHASPADFDPNATGTGDGSGLAMDTSTTPCLDGGQGTALALSTPAGNAATLTADTALISSSYGVVPVEAVATQVDGRLVLSYQVPRSLLETGVTRWVLRSDVSADNGQRMRMIIRPIYVQYHPSDLTSDTYLDTMDIIQAVDLFVQGQVTIETVAQVIDDVATSGTP